MFSFSFPFFTERRRGRLSILDQNQPNRRTRKIYVRFNSRPKNKTESENFGSVPAPNRIENFFGLVPAPIRIENFQEPTTLFADLKGD